MRRRILGFFIFIIILVVVVLSFNKGNLTGNVVNEGDYNIEKVVFKGVDGKEIYGLFYGPLKEEFDSVVVLPGAEGTKESRKYYAEILIDAGYGAAGRRITLTPRKKPDT